MKVCMRVALRGLYAPATKPHRINHAGWKAWNLERGTNRHEMAGGVMPLLEQKNPMVNHPFAEPEEGFRQ